MEDMKITDEHGQNGVGRRNVLQGAAWSVPIIASAIGVPAAVASPGCPTIAPNTATAFRQTMTNPLGTGWRPATSSMQVSLSENTSGNQNNIFAISSTVGGMTATVTSFSKSYSLPYQVNWTRITAGWDVSVVQSGGRWIYTFRLSSDWPRTLNMRTPVNSWLRNPATLPNAIPHFSATGTVVNSTVPASVVPIGGTQFSAYAVPVRTVSNFVANLPARCGGASARTFNVLRTMYPGSGAGNLRAMSGEPDASAGALEAEVLFVEDTPEGAVDALGTTSDDLSGEKLSVPVGE